MSYDYGHYLGQTRLSVSTRSPSSGRSFRDSPKSFSTLESYECSLESREPSACSHSSRLTVLKPDVDCASALVIRVADSASAAFMYFLCARREQMYDIASGIAIPCNPHFRIIYVSRFLQPIRGCLRRARQRRWYFRSIDGRRLYRTKRDEKGSL